MSNRPRHAARRRRERRRSAGLERDAAALYAAVSELVRVYQFRDRDHICCRGISVTQCYALETLVRRGPLALNDVAKELYLDKSTTSRATASLVRKGYVARSRSAVDGRAVTLEPTPAGLRLHHAIRRTIVAEERALLADLAPSVRQGAAALILRLARAAAARAARLLTGH